VELTSNPIYHVYLNISSTMSMKADKVFESHTDIDV